MLRSVRSIPSLRVLQFPIRVEAQQQAVLFSPGCNLSNTNTLHGFEGHSQLQSPIVQSKRFVHQTSKKQQTSLLNSRKSDFALMSLKSLKQECRKRGLKVSGKKADLVLRVQSYDDSFSSAPENATPMSTLSKPKLPKKSLLISNLKYSSVKSQKSPEVREFSQSANTQAKGDSSHIDFIKPVDIKPLKLVADDYIVKIPSISAEASKKTVTALEKELSQQQEEGDRTIVSKAEGSDTKIFEQGSFDEIAEQNTKAEEAEFEDIDGTHESDESYEYDYSEISPRDKTFWTSALAIITGLFIIKKKILDCEKVDK